MADSTIVTITDIEQTGVRSFVAYGITDDDDSRHVEFGILPGWARSIDEKICSGEGVKMSVTNHFLRNSVKKFMTDTQTMIDRANEKISKAAITEEQSQILDAIDAVAVLVGRHQMTARDYGMRKVGDSEMMTVARERREGEALLNEMVTKMINKLAEEYVKQQTS